jgi:GntR family transcriptional repressor for pyruvate dehydrogenase complex
MDDTTVDSRRAWELVLERIEGDLIAGRLLPGDHLPPERALAAELGVGRSSVREALRVLEVLGLIRTQTGSGPQSGAIIVARPSGGMSALMRLQVAAQGFVTADVVKTRLVLEAAVVSELSAQSPDLGPAAEILDAMDAELGETEFLALDAAFHLSLAEASGNEVVAAMMAGLRHSVESYVTAGAVNLPSWSTTSARLRLEHREIVAAIEAGDPALASSRIRSHIETYYVETNFIPARQT